MEEVRECRETIEYSDSPPYLQEFNQMQERCKAWKRQEIEINSEELMCSHLKLRNVHEIGEAISKILLSNNINAVSNANLGFQGIPPIKDNRATSPLPQLIHIPLSSARPRDEEHQKF